MGLFLKPFGVAGLMWLFAGLYLFSGMLALTLRLPPEEALPKAEVLLRMAWLCIDAGTSLIKAVLLDEARQRACRGTAERVRSRGIVRTCRAGHGDRMAGGGQAAVRSPNNPWPRSRNCNYGAGGWLLAGG